MSVEKSPNIQSLRDQLRAKTIGRSKKGRTQSTFIDIDGEQVEFELRTPSLEELDWILEQKTTAENGHERMTPMLVAILLKCVFVPGEGKRLFEAGDRERLAQEPPGTWAQKLAEAAGEFLKTDVDAAKKNSSPTPSASPDTQ